MPRTVRAALIQATWTGDMESMIAKHENYARQAAAAGSQVICFQELFYRHPHQFGLGEIGNDELVLLALVCWQLLHHRFQFFFIARQQYHGGTHPRQLHGSGFSYSLRAAAYQCVVICK